MSLWAWKRTSSGINCTLSGPPLPSQRDTDVVQAECFAPRTCFSFYLGTETITQAQATAVSTSEA
eukprot:1156632-Pelagomonas_calceolata.AAC.8